MWKCKSSECSWSTCTAIAFIKKGGMIKLSTLFGNWCMNGSFRIVTCKSSLNPFIENKKWMLSSVHGFCGFVKRSTGTKTSIYIDNLIDWVRRKKQADMRNLLKR